MCKKKPFWKTIKRPILVLAPMAGYTDQPFRLICKEFGLDVMFSEMVSSDAIWHQKLKTKNEKLITNVSLREGLYKTLKLIQFFPEEQPFAVQIFGANPEHMAYAAEYISSGEWYKDYKKIPNNKFQITNKFQYLNSNDQNKRLEFGACDLELVSIPAGIDVNMGCPAKDIVKTGAGSALMKNPKLASQIIKAIKKKTKLPVSIKTRLGWNDSKSILEFSRTLEQAGADAITIHGRTYRQGFNGEADWEMIYKVKKQLKIPVIGNGGINIMSKLKCQMSKLDGLMVGRGALGRPWIFKKLRTKNDPPATPEPACHARHEWAWRSDGGRGKLKTNVDFIKKTVLKHAKLVQKIKGERGIVEFRKHLAWYFREIPNVSHIRQQLVRVNTLKDIEKILTEI